MTKSNPRNNKAVDVASVISAEYKTSHKPDALAHALHEAVALDGRIDLKRLTAIANENDIDASHWGRLNNGMRVMNIANMLRARARRGELVTIGGHKFRGRVS